MKRLLLAILLLACVSAFAQVDATWNFQFFTGQSNAVRRVEITPVAWGRQGNAIITPDRLRYTNDGAGSLTVSNMATNFAYRVEFQGPFATLSFTNYFPIGTTGAVNAADYLVPTNNAGALIGYTVAQANGRFVLKDSGSSTNQRHFGSNIFSGWINFGGEARSNWPSGTGTVDTNTIYQVSSNTAAAMDVALIEKERGSGTNITFYDDGSGAVRIRSIDIPDESIDIDFTAGALDFIPVGPQSTNFIFSFRGFNAYVSASNFLGSGAGLTGIPISGVSRLLTGGLTNTILSGYSTLIDGNQGVTIDGFSGTLAVRDITNNTWKPVEADSYAAYGTNGFTGDGSGLTNLNISGTRQTNLTLVNPTVATNGLIKTATTRTELRNAADTDYGFLKVRSLEVQQGGTRGGFFDDPAGGGYARLSLRNDGTITLSAASSGILDVTATQSRFSGTIAATNGYNFPSNTLTFAAVEATITNGGGAIRMISNGLWSVTMSNNVSNWKLLNP